MSVNKLDPEPSGSLSDEQIRRISTTSDNGILGIGNLSAR